MQQKGLFGTLLKSVFQKDTDPDSYAPVVYTLPYGFFLASTQISGEGYMTKYGYNPNVGSQEAPIWGEGGDYPYPDETQVITVSSSSGFDSATGTGAKSVIVHGLDINYQPISQITFLSGQTPVFLPTRLLRINRMTIVTAGSNGKNAGIVYAGYGSVLSGKPQFVMASILEGQNGSLQAIFTVPDGKRAYIFTASIRSNKLAEVSGFLRPYGGIFVTGGRAPVDGFLERDLFVPSSLPSRSDFELRAKVYTPPNAVIGASFDILIV